MNEVNLIVMKIKMFITSYLPLYLILMILQLNQYPLTISTQRIDIPATVLAVALALFIIISLWCTVDLITTKGNERYKYSSINRTGDAVISYMMTYIVPLLSETFLSYDGFIINVSLFILVAIMYVKLDLVYFNPTWIIFGYNVYVANNGDFIISNIPYGKLKQNSNNTLKSSYLVKGVYLIQKRDNIT